MVKKAVKAEINTFVKGFITEATALNFPENASFSEENFELNRDGTRNRRLGMNYEFGSDLIPAGLDYTNFVNDPISTYVWTNAGGLSNTNFLVVQIGQLLHIFNLFNSTLSSSLMTSFNIAALGGLGRRHSMVNIDGRLVIVAGTGTIGTITFDGTNFSYSGNRLKVRDQWGVAHQPTDDDPTFRPTSPTPDYIYNLYNQSWGIPRRYSATTATDFDDPTDIYNGTYLKYPSNSEVVWTGIQMQPRPHPETPYEMMYPTMYAEVLGASTLAPRGYFILDLLDRGASRAAGIANNASKYPELSLTEYAAHEDRTTGGASCVCEFAGRVFYAGFEGQVFDGDAKSPDLSSHIAFSQLVRNSKDIVKCYQEGDPTSRESNDVVDTDGGLIRVSGAEKIQKMVNLGSHLLVFAKNGVWAISGGSDYGFTATNYKVDRLTEFGVTCDTSVVVESARAFFWSLDGIYVVAKDQFGTYSANNITQTTIQTWYDSLSSQAKAQVVGEYDTIGKKIRWVYQNGTRFVLGGETKELILDLSLNAFSINNLRSAVVSQAEVIGVFDFDPIVGISDDGLSEIGKVSTRYVIATIILGTPYFTIGYYNNKSFLDWKGINGTGVDAKAFLLTGAITAGDSSVDKQAPYLTMHFKRTETGLDGSYNLINPSGCLVRSQWDFTDTIDSNKWSSLFQAYRYRQAFIPDSNGDFDTGYDLVTSKSKLRGRGKALSLYFETEPGKDCNIIGWNININGNAVT